MHLRVLNLPVCSILSLARALSVSHLIVGALARPAFTAEEHIRGLQARGWRCVAQVVSMCVFEVEGQGFQAEGLGLWVWGEVARVGRSG